MTTINIDGITVKADIPAIISRINNLEWSWSTFNSKSAHHDGFISRTDKSELEAIKQSAIQELNEMANKPKVFESKMKRALILTQAGKVAGRGKMRVITLDAPMGCDDYYGSYSYRLPVVQLRKTGDHSAELYYDTVSEQSPF